MNLPLRLVLPLLIAGAVSGGRRGDAVAQEMSHPAHAAGRPSAAVAWLAGCWEQRAGERLIEEQWLAPRGGLLLGVSRTTRGDSLVEYEFVRIYERGDTLVFAAQPSGQRPAEFPASTVGPDEVVFENTAHDFPQRIRYARGAADSLEARVSGAMGGREREIVFRYGRVRCSDGGDAP